MQHSDKEIVILDEQWQEHTRLYFEEVINTISIENKSVHSSRYSTCKAQYLERRERLS